MLRCTKAYQEYLRALTLGRVSCNSFRPCKVHVRYSRVNQSRLKRLRMSQLEIPCFLRVMDPKQIDYVTTSTMRSSGQRALSTPFVLVPTLKPNLTSSPGNRRIGLIVLILIPIFLQSRSSMKSSLYRIFGAVWFKDLNIRGIAYVMLW